MEHYLKIAVELNIPSRQVQRTIALLDEGATIPFISRYRKEITGSLDEVAITNIRDRLNLLTEMDKRRKTILDTIEEQGLLTEELKNKILEAETLAELEDLYLPYKPKRKTRATIAIAKGLEPLAQNIFVQYNCDLQKEAAKFIDEEKGVSGIEEALAGARDIIAEWVNEDASARTQVRNYFTRNAFIYSKVAKGKEEEGNKYETWFDFSEPAMKAPSHRILAMFRGEQEDFLKIKIEPESQDEVTALLERKFVKASNESAQQVRLATKDSYKRLMAPSMETEFRNILKERADKEAIRVFAENLRQLLLASPLGRKNVLALDPGFRTGCKVVCLDRDGKLLHNETIYPHPPQSEIKEAAHKIEYLVNAFKTEAIAIGNGTAGRETEYFIKKLHFDKDIIVVMVNENGASVYSASSVAREEFPDYDVTVRGAVSIGRRLMDPLSELVKIDPKSIGVGQYQHDVSQNALQQSLEDVVVSCVNNVGVELNTASKQLLSYVSGIGNSLAENIINYRNTNGSFTSRESLKKVPRFGEKAFEQAAGFLRINDAKNPLDTSAVHPERYGVVQKMANQYHCSIEDLLKHKEIRSKIDIKQFITDDCGLPTLTDIMQELDKPGRDPRTQFEIFEFDKTINSINDLHTGMVVPGIVTNITAFGAFVDIGVHQDGLVHVSQMANRFISDPNEVVKINQKLLVKILDIDVPRKRIQLSMKIN